MRKRLKQKKGKRCQPHKNAMEMRFTPKEGQEIKIAEKDILLAKQCMEGIMSYMKGGAPSS